MSTVDTRPSFGVIGRVVRSKINAVQLQPTVAQIEPALVPAAPEDIHPKEKLASPSPNKKVKAFDRLKKLAKFKKERAAQKIQATQAAEGKDPIESSDVPGNDSDPTSDLPVDDDIDLTQPSGLAQKIRALIDALPSPSPRSSRTLPDPKKTKPPARDSEGRPIPPPAANRTDDSKLIALLSRATIMNGKSNTNRESVWTILDSLGPPKHDEAEGEPDSDDGTGGDGASHIGSDDSSIMLYAPLVPTEDSVVALADTRLVPITSEHLFEIQTLHSFSFWPPNFWPFTAWAGKAEPAPEHENSDSVPAVPSGGPSDAGASEIRVWVPSATQLSFQVMWWGYRMYVFVMRVATITDSLSSDISLLLFWPS